MLHFSEVVKIFVCKVRARARVWNRLEVPVLSGFVCRRRHGAGAGGPARARRIPSAAAAAQLAAGTLAR